MDRKTSSYNYAQFANELHEANACFLPKSWPLEIACVFFSERHRGVQAEMGIWYSKIRVRMVDNVTLCTVVFLSMTSHI